MPARAFTYINPVMELSLDHILTPQVGLQCIVALLPLRDKLLLVVRTLQVLTKLLPVTRA